MKQYYPKISVAALLVGIALMFTSYVPELRLEDSLKPERGQYALLAKGEDLLELHGNIAYSLETMVSEKGIPYTTLSFYLEHGSDPVDHSMDFIIKGRKINGLGTTGTYRIPSRIDGFIDNFEGVFGFANIENYGEEPFFYPRG